MVFNGEKKQKVRKIHCLLGRIKSHRKHEWVENMYRMSCFVNVEWNILICWSRRLFITLRFHFLSTAGEPLFQKHWSTKWVSKSLKWLKKNETNKKEILSLPNHLKFNYFLLVWIVSHSTTELYFLVIQHTDLNETKKKTIK